MTTKDKIKEIALEFGVDLIGISSVDRFEDDFFYPDSQEWKIISSLNKTSSDIGVSKTVNDSFYRSKLKEKLISRGINEIIVTVYVTDFCVDTTVKTALVNDFNVTVISDAHTTTDRPKLKAKQLIDYFNWQ